MGREYHILGYFAPPEAVNRTNRPARGPCGYAGVASALADSSSALADSSSALADSSSALADSSSALATCRIGMCG